MRCRLICNPTSLVTSFYKLLTWIEREVATSHQPLLTSFTSYSNLRPTSDEPVPLHLLLHDVLQLQDRCIRGCLSTRRSPRGERDVSTRAFTSSVLFLFPDVSSRAERLPYEVGRPLEAEVGEDSHGATIYLPLFGITASSLPFRFSPQFVWIHSNVLSLSVTQPTSSPHKVCWRTGRGFSPSPRCYLSLELPTQVKVDVKPPFIESTALSSLPYNDRWVTGWRAKHLGKRTSQLSPLSVSQLRRSRRLQKRALPSLPPLWGKDVPGTRTQQSISNSWSKLAKEKLLLLCINLWPCVQSNMKFRSPKVTMHLTQTSQKDRDWSTFCSSSFDKLMSGNLSLFQAALSSSRLTRSRTQLVWKINRRASPPHKAQ